MLFRKEDGNQDKRSFRLIKSLDFEAQDYPGEKIMKTERGNVYKISHNEEFGPTIITRSIDLFNKSPFPKEMKVIIDILPESASVPAETALVCSFEKRGEPYAYFSTEQPLTDSLSGEIKMQLYFEIPEIRSKKDEVRFYIWNKGREEFFIDNLNVFIK